MQIILLLLLPLLIWDSLSMLCFRSTNKHHLSLPSQDEQLAYVPQTSTHFTSHGPESHIYETVLRIQSVEQMIATGLSGSLFSSICDWLGNSGAAKAETNAKYCEVLGSQTNAGRRGGKEISFISYFLELYQVLAL